MSADQSVEIYVGDEPASESNPVPTSPAAGSPNTVVDQGDAGADPWKVDDDALQALVTTLLGYAFAATATVTSVNDQATSTTLHAATAGRKGLHIFNNSSSILYVKFGVTASATDFTVLLQAGQVYEMPAPIYTGRIDGIWSADASGAALVTELT